MDIYAQESNCCKLYANTDGFAVAEGDKRGGIFLRSVFKVFRDVNWVSTHNILDIQQKIREYTKVAATICGNLSNFTQLVENVGTLERDIRFQPKYHVLNDGNDSQVVSHQLTLKIWNLSNVDSIYILVENEMMYGDGDKHDQRLRNILNDNYSSAKVMNDKKDNKEDKQKEKNDFIKVEPNHCHTFSKSTNIYMFCDVD